MSAAQRKMGAELGAPSGATAQRLDFKGRGCRVQRGYPGNGVPTLSTEPRRGSIASLSPVFLATRSIEPHRGSTGGGLGRRVASLRSATRRLAIEPLRGSNTCSSILIPLLRLAPLRTSKYGVARIELPPTSPLSSQRSAFHGRWSIRSLISRRSSSGFCFSSNNVSLCVNARSNCAGNVRTSVSSCAFALVRCSGESGSGRPG
jgi:hypothetical protein